MSNVTDSEFKKMTNRRTNPTSPNNVQIHFLMIVKNGALHPLSINFLTLL